MSLHANFRKENYWNSYFVVEGWLLRLLWSLWYFLQGTLLAQVKTLSAIHPLYARLCCDFSLYTLLTNGAVVDQWTSLKRGNSSGRLSSYVHDFTGCEMHPFQQANRGCRGYNPSAPDQKFFKDQHNMIYIFLQKVWNNVSFGGVFLVVCYEFNYSQYYYVRWVCVFYNLTL